MKAPSKNISKSLKGQAQGAGGRGSEEMSVSSQRAGGPTMITPGDGKVESPPGTPPQAERSAAKFVEPQKRYGGG